MSTVPLVIRKDGNVLFEFDMSERRCFGSENFLCGKFDPPLPGVEEYIHFQTISYYGIRISLNPSNQILELNTSTRNQFINIIKPVPIPVKKSPILAGPNDNCYSHLFIRDTETNDLKYLSSTYGHWKDYHQIITHELSNNGLPLFNIKVSIINENETAGPFSAEKFFSGSVRYGRKILILIVSSDLNLNLNIRDKNYSTSKLPSIAKYVAELAAVKLRSEERNREIGQLLRRVLTVAINGGVAVDLIKNCQLKVGEVQLGSDHFSRTVLHLNNDATNEELLLEYLDVPIGNLIHYLKPSSNEASFCGMFWNNILNLLFRFGESSNTVPDHRIEQEWNSALLYKDLSSTNRRIDLVTLFDFKTTGTSSGGDDTGTSKRAKLLTKDVPIPILTLEASRYGFSRDSMHKDFGKILGLISANCITLARLLIQAGKKPEEARAYGILIGGTNVQFCTAHAVVTHLRDNSYEVHANITSDDHWFIGAFESTASESIVAGTEESCDKPCCLRTHKSGYESLQSATAFVNFNGFKLSESDSITIPDDACACACACASACAFVF